MRINGIDQAGECFFCAQPIEYGAVWWGATGQSLHICFGCLPKLGAVIGDCVADMSGRGEQNRTDRLRTASRLEKVLSDLRGEALRALFVSYGMGGLNWGPQRVGEFIDNVLDNLGGGAG